MQQQLATPWFDSALTRLEPRRGERALAFEPRQADVHALCVAFGDEGELTVVYRDRHAAEQWARNQPPQLRVLAHETTGGERFGTFDAIFAAPKSGPLLPPDLFARLIRDNLRPGGRFVVDLPSTEMQPDIGSGWADLGWDEERLAPIRGPADEELVEALRGAGLRSVENSLGSHLLAASSTAEFVAAFAEELELHEDEVIELAHAIVRKRQETGPVELLVHRSQATGRR